VDEPRLVAFKGFVGQRGFFGLEGVEVANAVAEKTPIKARANGLGAKKFVGDGQQILQGQRQHLSDFNHDLFLRECKRGLKPLWGVGRVIETVATLPLVNGAFTQAITQRQSCSGLRTGRHLSTGDGGRVCVFVQGNHHDKTPSLAAVVTQSLSIKWHMTSLAMDSG